MPTSPYSSEINILTLGPSLKSWIPTLTISAFVIVTGIMMFMLSILTMQTTSIVLGAGVVFLILPAFRTSNTEYFVTDRRVFRRSGLVFKRNKEIPVSEIRDIGISWGAWGKIFGVGTLTIEGASSKLKLDGVEDPEKVRERILSLR